MMVVFAVETEQRTVGRAVRGQVGGRMVRNLAASRRLVRHDAVVAGRVPDVVLVRWRIMVQIRLMKVRRIEVCRMIQLVQLMVQVGR